jgi:Tol biopolymer transport system component
MTVARVDLWAEALYNLRRLQTRRYWQLRRYAMVRRAISAAILCAGLAVGLAVTTSRAGPDTHIFLPLVLRSYPREQIAIVVPKKGTSSTASYFPELHLVSADGLDQSFVASYGEKTWCPPAPAWSPDGTRIAFSVNLYADIYVVSPDGTGLTALTHDGAWNWAPVWSPDGSRIAYTAVRPDGRRLCVMRADGTEAAVLTDSPIVMEGHSWSPDGRRIVFTSQKDPCSDTGEIHVIDVATLAEANLTNNPAHDHDPMWSPDGTKIAFVSTRVHEPLNWAVEDVFLMNADGSGLRRLTYNMARTEGLAWSPDGTKIAFAAVVGGNQDIYLVAPDGSGQVRLTTSSGSDHLPAWSPDGSRIAFISARDGGKPELYVMNADGTRQIRLTYGGAERASWQPQEARR